MTAPVLGHSDAFTEDHEAFRESIRAFVRKEVVPYYEDWEEAHQVPRDLFRKLAVLGATGFGIPEEYGGNGEHSYKFQAVMAEEAAREAVDFGHYHVSIGIVLPYLLRLASDAQKARWLPGVASGDTMLCIAMTEPGTGSDLAGIRTTATLSDDGSHYVVNGAKTFITGARNSELCVVVVRTAPPSETDRRHGLSLLVVPTDTPGFEYGRQLEKIGLLASDTSELAFTDMRVPAENLLGEADRAFSYLGQNLPRERLSIGYRAMSSAAAAVDFAIAYTRERKVYGRPLSDLQNTKFVLAECATEVASARALAERGLNLDETGELTAADAAKIKLHCTEVAGRVIDKCLQLHGGYGYMREYPIARLYADIRVSRIYGGTSEVLKTIISKEVL